VTANDTVADVTQRDPRVVGSALSLATRWMDALYPCRHVASSDVIEILSLYLRELLRHPREPLDLDLESHIRGWQ